jgi:TPR repeat protein
MTAESEQFFRDEIERAEAGDAKAQLEVGLGWLKAPKNYGIKQNFEKARYWFKKASDQGNLHARAHLGVMLSRGEGGTPDPDAAGKLLMECATTQKPGFTDDRPVHAAIATIGLGFDAAKMNMYFTKGWGKMSEGQRLALLLTLLS